MTHLPMEGKVLNENDRAAAELRAEFARHGVFAVNLISSPGPAKWGMLVSMRFLATMLLVLIPLCAQDAPPQQRKGGGGGPPKNLKVLTPEQLQAGIMQQFARALGQNCQFCHVRGDFASDENPKKIQARSMITMAHDLNAKFPAVEGKVYVTCFTCHRGKTEPETVAPAPAPGGGQPQ